jgi:hypothetical protein
MKLQLAARRALSLKRLLVVAVLVGGGIALILAVYLFTAQTVGTVTGRLLGIRNLEFIEGVQHGNGVSPVCGCRKPPKRGWRGISFAARRVTLMREGRSPWTEWVLSSADPGAVALQGGTDYLQLLAVRFRPRGGFDPRWLVDGTLGLHGEVVSRASFGGYRLTLFTHQALHLGLLGSTPLAAWVPYPGSQVSLSEQASPFPQETPFSQIAESYSSSVGTVKNNGAPVNQQSYPVGDFLGPNLVIWTNDPSAHMPTTPFGRPARTGVVTALLIRRSTFSTRVGAVPLSDGESREFDREIRKHPDTALGYVYFGRYDHGRVILKVTRPVNSAAYAALRKRTALRPFKWISALGNPYVIAPIGAAVPAPPKDGAPPKPERYRLQEWFPPLPPYAGFNVFGPLRQLTLPQVRGKLLVGGSPVDVSGSGTVELSDVAGLTNGAGQEIVSAPLATSRSSASLQFRAVGSVRVNGTSESTFFDQNRSSFDLAGLVLTALGVAFALVLFLQAMRMPSQIP